MGIILLLLTSMLLLGCYFWGELIFTFIKIDDFLILKSNTGLKFGTGLAFLFGLFGFLVAFGIAYPILLMVITFSGVVFRLKTVYEVSNKLKYFFTRSNILRWVAIPLVAICGLSVTVDYWWNGCDDWPGYVFMVQKLSATGGMIDPFLYSRALSFGSINSFYSMYFKVGGVVGLRGFDFIFCTVLIAILIVGQKYKNVICTFIAVLLSFLIVIGTGVGVIQNISPHFFISLIVILMCFAVLYGWKIQNSRSLCVLFAYLGLLEGCLVTARPEYAVFPSILIIAFAAHHGVVRSLKKLAVSFVAFLLVTSGWSFALFRSSKTFFYPIMQGTVTASPPSTTWGVGRVISQFIVTLKYDGQGVIFAMSFIVIIFVASLNSESRWYFNPLIIILIAEIIQLLSINYLLQGFNYSDIARYQSPVTYGSAIVITIFGLKAIDQALGADLIHDSRIRNKVRTNLKGLKDVPLLTLLAVFVLVFNTYTPIGFGGSPSLAPLLNVNFHTTINAAETQFASGVSHLLRISQSSNPELLNKSEILKMNKIISPNSVVLAEIENPGLLDLAKFDVFSNTMPNLMSNVVKSGPKSLSQYLIDHHIQQFIIESPNNTMPSTSEWINSKLDYNRVSLKKIMISPLFSVHIFGKYVIFSSPTRSARPTVGQISTFLNNFNIE